jgi:hypothetical protein
MKGEIYQLSVISGQFSVASQERACSKLVLPTKNGELTTENRELTTENRELTTDN